MECSSQFLNRRSLLKSCLKNGWGTVSRPEGQIGAFINNTLNIDPETEGFLIQGQVFPNPFLYGQDATRWHSARPIDVLTGFQHGDLNIANILTKFAEDSENLEGYFLIDFAFYKPKMPLLYDQNYLEISVSDLGIKPGILPEMGFAGYAIFKP